MIEQILNGIVPVLVYTAIGFVLGMTDVFSSKQHQILITLTFTIYFPISTIYSLGRKEITRQDFQLVGCYYVSSALLYPVVYILSKVLYRRRYPTAFAHMAANILIQNIIVTGLPIASGFYAPAVAEKYAYIIAFSQFTSTIPIALYLFEYAALAEAHGDGKLSCKKVCNLILNSIWKTLKNPMMLGIFGALLYNFIKKHWVPSLSELPVYLSNFFGMFRTLVNSFGVFAIGVFTSNEWQKLRAKKQSAQQQRPELQPSTAGDEQLVGDVETASTQPQVYVDELPLSKLPFWANFLIQMFIRHIAFPLIQTVCMRVIGLPIDVVKINATLASCSTGLQSFALSNTADFEPAITGMMILLGMLVDAALTPVLDWIAGL